MKYTNEQSASVIEAPNRSFTNREHHLFLAGGITNCPDWQTEVIEGLSHHSNLNIFNPRRTSYPMDDPLEAERQITWEFDFLKDATEIAVWFSKGSMNPIVLYELGLWVNSRPEIPAFIGVHPDYPRKVDVEIQTKLARPEIEIVYTIGQLCVQIDEHLASFARSV